MRRPSLSQVAAFFLIPWLIFRSAPTTAPSPALNFSTQALAERLGTFPEELTRRPTRLVFHAVSLRRPALRTSIATLTLSLIAVPWSWGQAPSPLPGESKPLPFSTEKSALTAEDQAHLDTLVSAFDQRVRRFQESTYSFDASGKMSVHAKSMVDYENLLNQFYASIAEIVINSADPNGSLWTAEMERKGWITKEVGASYRLRLTNLGMPGPNQDFLLREFLPEYFAHYGFYFTSDLVGMNGLPLPALQLRPIVRRDVRTETLEVFNGAPIAFQWLELGPSVIRTPHQWNAHLPTGNRIHTRASSDQVFVDNAAIEEEIQMDVQSDVDSLKWFSQNGRLHTAAEIPNPILRAAYNMVLMNWKTLHPTATTVTEIEVDRYLRPLLPTLHERHEAVHVHDRPSAIPPTKDYVTLMETRATVASAIGEKDVVYETASLIGQSTLPSAIGSVHGRDLVFIRNRLAFWLWQDPALRRTLTQRHPEITFPVYDTPVLQFQDLPPQVAEAVVNAFPYLSAEDWWGLYRKIWTEIQPNDNPLTRGLETKPESRPTGVAPRASAPEKRELHGAA